MINSNIKSIEHFVISPYSIIVIRLIELDSGELELLIAHVDEYWDLDRDDIPKSVIDERRNSFDFKWIDDPETMTQWFESDMTQDRIKEYINNLKNDKVFGRSINDYYENVKTSTLKSAMETINNFSDKLVSIPLDYLEWLIYCATEETDSAENYTVVNLMAEKLNNTMEEK